mmetsp:Transcript_87333/g.159624  ORF Transcript_87333/g.159624 Transcript_87333/m.159624 type:complete len:178 (-) Transcript_87333:31-564(-)
MQLTSSIFSSIVFLTIPSVLMAQKAAPLMRHENVEADATGVTLAENVRDMITQRSMKLGSLQKIDAPDAQLKDADATIMQAMTKLQSDLTENHYDDADHLSYELSTAHQDMQSDLTSHPDDWANYHDLQDADGKVQWAIDDLKGEKAVPEVVYSYQDAFDLLNDTHAELQPMEDDLS